MALTNPATVIPPTSPSEVSVSTGSGTAVVSMAGPCWYTLQAISATSYVLFASTSVGMSDSTSASWSIPAGTQQSFQVYGESSVMKAMGSATGRLKYYVSGG